MAFFDDLDDQDLLAAALRAEELGKWLQRLLN